MNNKVGQFFGIKGGAFAITLSANPERGFAYIAINAKVTVRFQSVVEGMIFLQGVDKAQS